MLLVGGWFCFLMAAPAQALEPGLSDRHRHMLKALGLPVVVPKYIPSGYQVERVEVRWVAGQGPGDGPEYAIGTVSPVNRGPCRLRCVGLRVVLAGLAETFSIL